MKRLFIVAALLLLSAGVVILLRPKAQTVSIPSKGGKPFTHRNPTPVQYLQRDPRWSEQTIGGSGESIGAVGCTLCSVANSLAAHGHPVTPAELNDHLKNAGGYTAQGWLVWSAVPHAKIDIHNQPSHAAIDSAIQAGDFPLVKFWIMGTLPHWVVIVGKEESDYIALDPLSEGERSLSSLTTRIYSLRIVRKKE